MLRTTTAWPVRPARGNLAAGAAGDRVVRDRPQLPAGKRLPDEHTRVAAVLQGGFLRAKGVVEALYAAIKAETTHEPATFSSSTPARRLVCRKWLGELHPALLEGEWSAFELDLAALLSAAREFAWART